MAANKKLYTVMVEVNVEANSLSDAEKVVQYQLAQHGWPKSVVQVEVQSNYETDNYNNRVFYAHPADVDAEYDMDVYWAELEAEWAEDLKDKAQDR